MSKSKTPSYWVLIPAAGVGRRMCSEISKQYLKISGKTILEHAISRFATYPMIEKIVVILSAHDLQWPTIHQQIAEKAVTVEGGQTRADSVMHGLQYLTTVAAENDWVLVHDASRPCLSLPVLDRFFHILSDHPVGGLLAVPIVDTLKRVDANGYVQETLSREELWAAQTPQMFRYALLYNAMERALSHNIEVTDEASAIEYYGKSPLVVKGDRGNIKVTWFEDLAWAERIDESVSQ